MITEEKKKQIVLRNCIKVDDTPVKYQEITINGDSPTDICFTEYFANDEAKVIYKKNRAEIRKLEAAFEDEAYAEQESLKVE